MMKRFFLLIILIIFAGFAYVLWPSKTNLPILDTIDPFVMQTIANETYTSDNDKIKVIAFIYTNCPDICPLTMNDFKKLQKDLKEKKQFATDVELVAITFDPERDSNETLLNYANAFQADFSGWKWLRGNEEKTKEVTGRFNLIYNKSTSGYYSHQTTFYLVDDNNKLRAIYKMSNPNQPIDKDKILNDIDLLLNE